MWFKLASATFSTHLGSMSSLSNSISIKYTANGFSYTTNSVTKTSSSASLVLNLMNGWTCASTPTVSVTGAAKVSGTPTWANNKLTIAIVPSSGSKFETGGSIINVSVTGATSSGGSGGGTPVTPLITWTINGVNIVSGGLNDSTNRLASNIFSPADVKTITANGDFEFLLYAYSTSSKSSIIGRLNTEGNFTSNTVGTGQWLSAIDMSDYSSSQYYRLVCRYKSDVNKAFTSVISNCAIINGSLPEDDAPSTGFYTPDWINGQGIDLATGTIVVDNAARQTTHNMFTPGQVSTITANGDFEFLLYAYSTSSESSIIGRLSTEGNFTGSTVGTGQWLSTINMSSYPNQFYRLVCRYKSDVNKAFTSVVSNCATFA